MPGVGLFLPLYQQLLNLLRHFSPSHDGDRYLEPLAAAPGVCRDPDGAPSTGDHHTRGTPAHFCDRSRGPGSHTCGCEGFQPEQQQALPLPGKEDLESREPGKGKWGRVRDLAIAPRTTNPGGADLTRAIAGCVGHDVPPDGGAAEDPVPEGVRSRPPGLCPGPRQPAGGERGKMGLGMWATGWVGHKG